MILITY